MRKRLTTALVFALTVNLAIMAATQSIRGQGEGPRSTGKGAQSKSAEYSPGAGGSMNSKGDSETLDSPADYTEAGMNPTIAIFLGLSVLLVVVVAAVAASRGDIAKRQPENSHLGLFRLCRIRQAKRF